MDLKVSSAVLNQAMKAFEEGKSVYLKATFSDYRRPELGIEEMWVAVVTCDSDVALDEEFDYPMTFSGVLIATPKILDNFYKDELIHLEAQDIEAVSFSLEVIQ